MSELISKEEVIDDILKLAEEPSIQRNPDTVNGLLGAYNIVYEKPSADIMECARAIKEYCEKYDEHCVDCPFNSAKPTLWCVLGGSSLPHEWDLPEGDKAE